MHEGSPLHNIATYASTQAIPLVWMLVDLVTSVANFK